MASIWPFGKRGPGGPIKLRGTFWRPQGDLSLEGSEGIFAAVTRLSNILASIPLLVFKDNQPCPEHPVSRLLSYEAAPGITPFLYKSTLETCRNVCGNGYALKVYGVDGRVQRLDLIDPARVEPMREESSGEIWYLITPPSGQKYYIHYREMIHVKHISNGGMKGLSPVDVLRDALDYDQQMKTFSVRALRGINSCVKLELPTNIGEDQKRRIIENFNSNYAASSGNVVVLSGGMKADVITKSPVDSKVMDIERVTKSRIAAVYSLPPHMLGNFEGGGYGSNEQQMLELLQLTMRATFKQYAEEHSLKLLTWDDLRNGYRIGFDEEQLIIPTRVQKAQEAQYMVHNGIKKPNEVRNDMGLPAVPGGDKLMGSRDLAPIEYLMNNPETVKRYQ